MKLASRTDAGDHWSFWMRWFIFLVHANPDGIGNHVLIGTCAKMTLTKRDSNIPIPVSENTWEHDNNRDFSWIIWSDGRKHVLVSNTSNGFSQNHLYITINQGQAGLWCRTPYRESFLIHVFWSFDYYSLDAVGAAMINKVTPKKIDLDTEIGRILYSQHGGWKDFGTTQYYHNQIWKSDRK